VVPLQEPPEFVPVSLMIHLLWSLSSMAAVRVSKVTTVAPSMQAKLATWSHIWLRPSGGSVFSLLVMTKYPRPKAKFVSQAIAIPHSSDRYDCAAEEVRI
jgi:hypothetical protein